MYVMINTLFFSYNASIKVYRAQNIRNRIWPKRPTLHIQLTKTFVAKTSWPKRPTFVGNTELKIPGGKEIYRICHELTVEIKSY